MANGDGALALLEKAPTSDPNDCRENSWYLQNHLQTAQRIL